MKAVNDLRTHDLDKKGLKLVQVEPAITVSVGLDQTLAELVIDFSFGKLAVLIGIELFHDHGSGIAASAPMATMVTEAAARHACTGESDTAYDDGTGGDGDFGMRFHCHPR